MENKIIKGNFSVICDLRIEQDYLKKDEFCVKDENNKLFARKFKYIDNGLTEISDRPLNIIYIEDIIENKKCVHFKYN